LLSAEFFDPHSGTFTFRRCHARLVATPAREDRGHQAWQCLHRRSEWAHIMTTTARRSSLLALFGVATLLWPRPNSESPSRARIAAPRRKRGPNRL